MTARRLLRVVGACSLLSFAAAVPAVAQGVQLFAVLNGGNEVGSTGKASAGDPDGSGAASVIVAGPGEICVAIEVTGLDKPNAAHIHEAVAGENGDIVVPLTAPSQGNPGTAAGCTKVAQKLIGRIVAEPSRFYVNVHTGKFPAGAVRGQLF
jgi:hypothetical protein